MAGTGVTQVMCANLPMAVAPTHPGSTHGSPVAHEHAVRLSVDDAALDAAPAQALQLSHARQLSLHQGREAL